MSRAPGPLVDEIRALCPSFAPAGAPRRTVKSILLPGSIDNRQRVIAKKIVHADPVWRWYFDRELAIYRAFDSNPPPVRVPRLIASDTDNAILVLEELPGAPLSAQRAATQALEDRTLQGLMEVCDRLGDWDRGLSLSPSDPPSAQITRALRSRLLEDPTGPLDWQIEGIARCARLGIIGDSFAARLTDALRAYPTVRFAHGDLLLRNVVRDADTGDIAIVDWECAGAHPQDWDRALLWAALPAAQRALIETAISMQRNPARISAFRAGCAFAVAREIKFRRASNRSGADARGERLHRDLRALERALARR